MKKKIRFYGVAAALAILAVLLYAFYDKGVRVKSEKIGRNTLLITVSATSTGTVKSEKEYSVTAERVGKISKLYAEEGDAVKEGQLLAKFDTEDAALELKRAEATFNESVNKLKESVEAYEPFKGQIDNDIKKTKAIVDEANSRLSRYCGLNEKGYVPEETVEQIKKDRAVAEASYDTALSARKNLDSKIYAIKAREHNADEAEKSLELSRLNYGYSFVRAACGGVITAKQARVGALLAKGAMIYSIVSMEPLYFEAFIDEADVPKVAVGQDVKLSMDAYPDKELRGKVYRISPVVLGSRLEARTFEVRISLTAQTGRSDPPKLKPGMSSDVEIITGKVENALLAPSHAIIERGGKSFLYVVYRSRAVLKEIGTGPSNWTYTVIKSGVAEGDEVITTIDAVGLKDGTKVRLN
ncbi:MAG: efflux RND transporter periplasmic adaptor subunit [Nitrospirae bacterium]|nr:efflux RND transporter periplasmic adaptor subunit [Nitrospirota bacterium]